jgi:hypothetical protein
VDNFTFFYLCFQLSWESEVSCYGSRNCVSPNPKPGKTVTEVTAEAAVTSYNSDELSRAMPGRKDYVPIKGSGVEIHEQKLLLCSVESIILWF